MPDYSTWAHEISEGSEEHRLNKLAGICAHLDSCWRDLTFCS
jgi:hypothetical protein